LISSQVLAPTSLMKIRPVACWMSNHAQLAVLLGDEDPPVGHQRHRRGRADRAGRHDDVLRRLRRGGRSPQAQHGEGGGEQPPAIQHPHFGLPDVGRCVRL
jgi:hypothetical protein